MNKTPEYSKEEKELAASIMSYVIRNAANEFPFLRKPLCILKAVPDKDISTFCADYKNIYYDPGKVIEQYRKNKKKLVENVVHIVLHSLLLHPSMTKEQDRLFDAAADASVFYMMRSADALAGTMTVFDKLEKVIRQIGSTSAADIYTAACESSEIKTQILAVSSVLKPDDHSLWYRRSEQGQERSIEGKCQDGISDNKIEDGKAVLIIPSGNDEKEWDSFLFECRELAALSQKYGSSHGNMFAEIKKPDRFSRFSYREYIRRFAMDEITCEDPETLDMIMYSWGMDNLHDIPIVEFCETKEQCVVSDIIIAMDMSGSCSGDIAVNFLRQLYTLFDQMNIRSSVNISVVTFDTEIISEFKVRSARDADKLLEKYEGSGWGGTDFNCVFGYADEYSRKNHGKKLKGLFFFSDAFGSFPTSRPSYRTTFFVPRQVTENGLFAPEFDFVPDWVELVKYED